MIQINFIDAFEQLNVWVKDVQKSVIRQSIKRSLKRTSKTLQKEVTTAIRTRRKIKVSDIKNNYTKLVDMTVGDNPWRFSAEIQISNKPMSLIYFVRGNKMPRPQKDRKVKRRLKLKIEVTPGQAAQVKHGFIAKLKGGNYQVMKREGKKSLPMTKQSVPGVAKLFTDQSVTQPLMARVGAQLQKEFVSNLRYYLDQSIARAKAKTGLGSKD
jgi:hypothetical protein